MDYATSERRNKQKDKKKRRKLFPYRKGGRGRTLEPGKI
jgi:hypothetical protein